MKQFVLVALFVSALSGCGTTPAPPRVDISALDPAFETQFDPLFLSTQPLRYQAARALLDSVEHEHYAAPDRERLVARMERFLAQPPAARATAADSAATGVASETALLRLQALRLIARFGRRDDMPFVRDLAAHPSEHPYFEQQRAEAIRDLLSLLRNDGD